MLTGLFLICCNNNSGTNVVPENNDRTTLLRKNLKLTEIHYHPLDEDTIEGNEFEFIELKNTGSSNLDLSGIAFTNGISFSFKSGTVFKPNSFIVLALDSAQFKKRYAFFPFDVYGGKLKNSGERIQISDTVLKKVIIDIRYDDQDPWPFEADGMGYSLVSSEPAPTGNPNEPSYWKASSKIHGSPGKDDAY
jgi:hypothetical protein